ncbi:MAG: VCBS repeat-containing protein, partial [Chlorobi bacterium]|nr:VCBS repeat-containing protein [Chlorobiota bacterium]
MKTKLALNLFILALFLFPLLLLSQPYVNQNGTLVAVHQPGSNNYSGWPLQIDVAAVAFDRIDNNNSLDLIFTQNSATITNPKTYGSYKLNDGNGNFNGTIFDFHVQEYVANGWTGKDAAFGQLRTGQQKDVGLGREACAQKFQNLNYSINSVFTVHSNQSNSISFGNLQPLLNVQDLVVAENGRIAVYYNDGQGNLPTTENAYTVSGTTGINTLKVIAKRLRTNQIFDLVTATSTRVRIYRNNGNNNITFLNEINPSNDNPIYDIDVADINNDGHQDLVVLTFENLKGFLNNGTGTISSSPVFSVSVPASTYNKIKLGMMESSDNFPEVAIAGADGHILILRHRTPSQGYYTYPYSGNQEFYGSGLFHISIRDIELADIESLGGLSLIVSTSRSSGFSQTDYIGKLAVYKHATTDPEPFPPVITSQEVVNGRAVIYFTNHEEPDFAGYNVYLSINGGPW